MSFEKVIKISFPKLLAGLTFIDMRRYHKSQNNIDTPHGNHCYCYCFFHGISEIIDANKKL